MVGVVTVLTDAAERADSDRTTRMFAACSYDSCLSLTSHSSAGPTSNLLTATDTSARPAATAAAAAEYNGLDFRITMDSRSGPPVTITLIASTLQEKAAWCSDISQVSVRSGLISPVN